MGSARAERYILEMHRAFETLASFPNLGRNAGHLRNGYFMFQHDQHSVFYQTRDGGVFVVRVLHQKQLPENYL